MALKVVVTSPLRSVSARVSPNVGMNVSHSPARNDPPMLRVNPVVSPDGLAGLRRAEVVRARLSVIEGERVRLRPAEISFVVMSWPFVSIAPW